MFCENIIDLKDKLAAYTTGIVAVLATEKDFDFSEIQPLLQKSVVPIVGAFFPGIIANGTLHYSGFLIQHFDFKYELQLYNSKNAEIASTKGTLDSGTGFVLMDGLADGNQSFLNSLFYEFGSTFKFIGSGAGSLDLVQKPCIFDKDGIYTDKAIVILLESDVAIGLKHGYDRIAGPFVATETDGSKIYELNWDNAFDCYSEEVNRDSNIKVTKNDFFDVSKGYPLGINRKGHEDIVRDPISVDENGVLHCIDDVPENAALYILKGEPTKLITAAKDSCKEAINKVSGTPQNCLFIDCVTRVLYLGDDFSKEIEEATVEIHNVYDNVSVEGVLSMGEISTFNDGRLELYNKTFLTTILCDKTPIND